MTVERGINALAIVTLLQMMVGTGLGVNLRDAAGATRRPALVLGALIANYAAVPAVALALLLALHADPMAAAGFVLVSVCPGAPYGPPFTAIARGNTAAAVGLMVILAGSSAFAAPLLLRLLLPIASGGEAAGFDALRLVVILALTQFLPLGAGLLLRSQRPRLAERLVRPMNRLTAVLNIVLIGTLLAVNLLTLAGIRPLAYAGMLALVLAALASGWLLGGRERKAVAISTSMRNVGVALVIATGCFAGTRAVAAVTAYALLQTIVMLLVVMAWGRAGQRGPAAAGVAP